MNPRQLKRITSIPDSERDRLLGEGLEALGKNIASIDAELQASPRGDLGLRAVPILQNIAEEEAAKAMMIFDIVRAGWERNDDVKRLLEAWYNHLARGIYAQLYAGRPACFEETAIYAAKLRKKVYLDGPDGPRFLLRNEILDTREREIYVDLYQDEKDNLSWVHPVNDHRALFSDYVRPQIVDLVLTLYQLGFLSQDGIESVRAVWSDVPEVPDDMHWIECRKMNIRVLEHFQGTQLDPKEDEDTKALLSKAIDLWIFPLFQLDLKTETVSPDEIKSQRKRAYPEEW